MFEDILKKISEPIDIGILLIFFVLGGLIGELTTITSSISSTSLAAMLSIGGLGVKRIIEAIFGTPYFAIQERRKRVKILKGCLEESKYDELNMTLKMLESKAINFNSFDKKIEDIVIESWDKIDWSEIKINNRQYNELSKVHKELEQKYKELHLRDENLFKNLTIISNTVESKAILKGLFGDIVTAEDDITIQEINEKLKNSIKQYQEGLNIISK